MAAEATQAIVLRRVEYGDYDLIVTLFTPDQGKMAVIAKSAKKSVKRFPGILELFASLEVVISRGRRKGGLAMLQEASLKSAFFHIRESILKTAYASYWSELLNLWLEEGQPQPALYRLLPCTTRGGCPILANRFQRNMGVLRTQTTEAKPVTGE